MKTVELTQYLRPDGRKAKVLVELDDEVAELSRDMILSCEVLTTGVIAIYARYKDQNEEEELLELAHNGPGLYAPDAVLSRLIKKLHSRRGIK